MWNPNYNLQNSPYGAPIRGPAQFDGAIYDSDDFRMYQFKIRRCPRTTSHDWTMCPFAHRGERAARRDPRRIPYSASPCAEFRNWGVCVLGESCPFSHGVFEQWLHPQRYRTTICTAGENCRRQVCFFVHNVEELRIGNPQRHRGPYEVICQSSLARLPPEFVPRGHPHARPRPKPSPVARPLRETSAQGAMLARAQPYATPTRTNNAFNGGDDLLASSSGVRMTKDEDYKGKSHLNSQELDDLKLDWLEELID